jgi:hypothetical protein
MPLRTTTQRRHRSLASSVTSAKKQAQDTRSPGQVGDKLRRKMGDALAEIFSTAGVKLYSDSVLQLKDGLENLLKEGISGLEGTIREELGNRGLSHAADLFKPWISELIEDIIHFGLEEISGGLEDLASDAAAEFSVKPEEDEDEAELLGAGEEEEPGEVETVEEQPVAAPTSDEGAETAVPGATPAPAPAAADNATGFELPGGEAAAQSDPRQPRTWRRRGKARVASTMELTPQRLANWIGGLDEVQRRAKTVPEAMALLQKVQAKAIRKIITRTPAIAVREADPLELLDYAHKFFPYHR